MDRPTALLLTVAFAIVVLVLLLVGWLRRRRSQRDLAIPDAVPAEPGEVRWRASGLHVVTTAAGDSLDRIAVHGLGFRARVDVTVYDRGVELDLHGERDLWVPRERIRAVDRSSAALDKGVEPDGLARLRWQLGPSATGTTDSDATELDTYLRVDETAALVAELQALLPPGAPADRTTLAPDPEGPAA